MTHSENDHTLEEADAAQIKAEQEVSVGVGVKRAYVGPNISHWFWGTIAVLLVVTLALNLLASWQSGRHGTGNVGQSKPSDQIEPMGTWVEQGFRTAEKEAEEVKRQIAPLLDDAYAPVYEGIPAYMDFHYSLKGEWLELSAAALGDIGSGLEKYLFSGLETRLKDLAEKLEQDFDERYLMALDEAMGEFPEGTADLGPVVTRAIDDAKGRIKKTVGVLGVGALGGVSLKAVTKAFAKKLGAKLAAKVAAKTGTKWAAAASGAGVGAGACSWTGPGAAGCAVVGAAVTWIGVDLAMIKLDEYVTRDDFDRELRDLIDQHKEETRQALEKMLNGKEKAVEMGRKVAVQAVSLSELEDAERLLACQAATVILVQYDSIRENLQARSPTNIAALRGKLKEQAESHLLAPWIDGMEAAIADQDFRPWVGRNVALIVDFPLELREEYKIRGALSIGETSLDFDWTEGDFGGYFALKTQLKEEVRLKESQSIELSLVQDRGWTGWDRRFTGATSFKISETLEEGSGPSPKPKILLPMLADKAGEPVPRVTLELSLVGEALSVQELPEFCMK